VQFSTSIQSSPPAVDLISMSQAKLRVRRDDDDDNDTIELLVAAAISQLDGMDGILGRALITQIWIDTWFNFPAGDRLPLALTPVSSVSSVSYFDANNEEQTIPAQDYGLHKSGDGSFYLRLLNGANWPSTYRRDDAVHITYSAGYGDQPADVPATIRLAALDLVQHWYDNPDPVVVGSITNKMPMSVEYKLRRFIRPHF
jgi:uncharacterized phiE125 gp8 family phage protein